MTPPPNLSFHNVSECEPLPDGGLALFRIPRHVRESLSPLGNMVGEDSAGIEIRFVTDAPAFRIKLGSFPSFLSPYEHHGQEIVIFRGSFIHSIHRIEPGRVNSIQVAPWNGAPLPEAASRVKRRGFSTSVWRVFLGRCARIFYGLETFGAPYRAPLREELPGRRWLAYGSSITNGASPANHLNSYVYHAARTANLDVLNLGLSGSCLCEAEMAEFLGSRQDYEVATLEVGVNMRKVFTVEEYRRKVHHLLDAVAAPGTNRRVFLLTLFSNMNDPELDEKQDAFSQVLREAASIGRWQGVSLIEGGAVLDDPGDLTVDLIHPSDYGHARMGIHLGEILRKALA